MDKKKRLSQKLETASFLFVKGLGNFLVLNGSQPLSFNFDTALEKN